MLSKSSSSRRTFASLAAVLAVGAGAGSVAAIALDNGGTRTVERVVATPSTQPASSGSNLTVNEIYGRS
jgi:hypothetical protein